MKDKILTGAQVLKSRGRDVVKLLILWIRADRRRGAIAGVFISILGIYACSRGEERVHYIYEGKEKQFSQDRVIENPYKPIADNKIEMMEESESRLRVDNREIERQISEMKASLEEIKKGIARGSQAEKIEKIEVASAAKPPEPVKIFDGAPNPPGELRTGGTKGKVRTSVQNLPKSQAGPFSVSFPVPVKREEKNTGVVIPTGSYVKAKVVSGVQVPMGETYPTLLQLDYAFVKPSNRRIDLSGCFIVAKSEGDLSTERLKMSPYSMSCYNKDGLFFKKDKLIGWASDTEDNDFALKAEVDLNQGRVAQTAFAKALIDGLGSSIERGTRSIGGKGIDDNNPEIILKDSGQKVGSQVAEYYLSYLQGLRPTMKVKSGRDAWLVLGMDIEIPFQYFRKEESSESKFTYVTNNILD